MATCNLKIDSTHCVAGTVREEFFCVRVLGSDCPVKIRAETTTNSEDCNDTTTLYYDADTGLVFTGDVTAKARVVCPAKVEVCGLATPPVVDIVGKDCTGADVPFQGTLQSQAIHNVPGVPLLVKQCPMPTEYDRAFAVLCAPDGTKVVVQNVTDETAPFGTAPAFEAWKLDGTAYAGPLAALVDCGEEKVDISEAMWFCASGSPISRVDFWSVNTTPRALLGSFWQDISGAVIAAPAMGSYTVGDCAGAIAPSIVHWCVNGVCTDGIAWYATTTGALVRVTTTSGTVVTTPAVLECGCCPADEHTDRPLCVNMTSGEVWDVVERTALSACGGSTLAYFDLATSPAADVTADVDSVRHAGECNCCEDTLPPPVANLRLAKTVSPASAPPNALITYTLTLDNDGPDAAGGSTLADLAPSGFNFVAVQSIVYAGGAAGLTGTFPNFTIGTLPSGGQVVITYTGTYAAVGSYNNTATATTPYGTVDPVKSNNTSTVINQVVQTPATLTIAKTAPAVVDANSPLAYMITVTNTGPGAADGAGFTDTLPGNFNVTGVAWAYTGGAAGGTQTNATTYSVATMPANSSAILTINGTFTSVLDNIGNTVTGVPPTSNPNATFPTPTATVVTCSRGWTPFHDTFSPQSTLFGLFRVGAGLADQFGTVDKTTGVVASMFTLAGTNLNALGLNKSNNNAIFIDRQTGNIYMANSPGYTPVMTSTLQAGPATAANAIMGAVDANGKFYIGAISGTDMVTVVVDPFTGVQTSIPALSGPLATNGQNGYDFDFAPNGDFYLLFGGRLYVSTASSGFAGWTFVGNPAIPSTAGSLAYDQGVLIGTTATGQMFGYNISTGVTTLGATLAGGLSAVDFAGALDPICKNILLNTCDNQYYELNKVTVYTGNVNIQPGTCPSAGPPPPTPVP
jgi:uncharacterized repeat protein (TIGR01451 family)